MRLPAASPIQFITPPLDDELDLDDDHDDAPLRFRTIDTILGASSPPRVALRDLDAQLHFMSAEVPPTFIAAERKPSWRAAMHEELDSIVDNST